MNRIILKESCVSYKIFRVYIEGSNISYDVKASRSHAFYVRERVNNVLKSSKWVKTSKSKLIADGILSDSSRVKY